MPALPLDEAGKYVAGAYIVFLAILLVYVGIMAYKLRRIESQMREIDQSRPAAGSTEQSQPSQPAAQTRPGAGVGSNGPETGSG